MKELKEKLLPYALVVSKLVYSSTDHVNESWGQSIVSTTFAQTG